MTATQTRAAAAIDGATGDPAAGAAIRPRRGLPGGRAVVGGLLVAVAAVGIFAAVSGAGAGPDTRYLVASRDLPPGEVLEAADVELVAVDLPESLRGRTFDRPDPVIGAVVVGPVAAGELIQAGGLADGTDAEVPTFSIQVPRADANGGDLQRGDFVQVLVTYGTDTSATTVAVSTDARVVTSSGGDDAITSSGDVIVRLAVPSAEERSAIVNATVTGRITLVRTSGAGEARATDSFRPTLDPDTAASGAPAGDGGGDDGAAAGDGGSPGGG